VVTAHRTGRRLWLRITALLVVMAAGHEMLPQAASAAEPLRETLIIAPHSDDEAIGCTALMLRALARNERIAIVVVTAGDGFPKAAAAAAQKPIAELKPSDYDALAALRQRHTLEAITSLGIAAGDIFFLGYPDGGLRAMYEADGTIPFKQPYTTRTATYGIVRPDYHSIKHQEAAPYVKSSVVADLAEIIRTRAPRAIFTTLDVDTHADHRAVALFVRDAVLASKYIGPVRGYVVHGAAPATEPDLRIVLTPEELQRKRRLLEIYQAGVSPVHDGLADEYTQPEERFWKLRLEPDSSKPADAKLDRAK